MSPTKRRSDTMVSLGQLLLNENIITQKELDNAVGEQKRSGQRLGQCLVSSGACSEADIAKVLAKQLGLTFTKLDPSRVDHQTLAELGERFCREHFCLPLTGENGLIILALADPFDIDTSEEVQRRTGKPVAIQVTTKQAVGKLIDAVADQSDRVEAILEGRDGGQGGGARTAGGPAAPSAERVVQAFLTQGIRRGSADIHVEPEEDLLRVRYRIDGVLQPGSMVPKDLSDSVIARLKLMADLDIAERRLPQDGRARLTLDGTAYDLRISVLPTIRGESAVMRVLDSSKAVLPMEQLGLRKDASVYLDGIIKRPHGMFLVTGPTGSGKSTTLYALLSRADALEQKVVTVEDPVEYKLPLIRQVQVNAEVGLTFGKGLRSILRQDPDIILVGEIRDEETAQIAVRAAMTGHLVISTLHTNTACGAFTRLVDIGVDPKLVASVLCGVLGQRLVRTLCVHCKESVHATPEDIERFHPSLRASVETLGKPVGCTYCGETGYRGRIAVHDLLPLDRTLKRMFLDELPEDEIAARAEELGVQSMLLDAQAKVASGLTTLEEIERAVVEE